MEAIRVAGHPVYWTDSNPSIPFREMAPALRIVVLALTGNCGFEMQLDQSTGVQSPVLLDLHKI